MEAHQRDNLLETLVNINYRERMKLLVGFLQFFALVFGDVAAVAQQAEEMLASGSVDEVQLGEGVSFVHLRLLRTGRSVDEMSFVQRPIMEALGAKAGKRRRTADAEGHLTMVTDALQATLQKLPGAQAARRATGLHGAEVGIWEARAMHRACRRCSFFGEGPSPSGGGFARSKCNGGRLCLCQWAGGGDASCFGG